MKKTLIVTFSGGRSSAFLARYIQLNCRYSDYNKIYVFANTSKEKEPTLKFIKDCQENWGMPIIWLEAKINLGKGNATTFNITDFYNAKRKGEIFEDMLKKYPLPNNRASNCTRELKERPISKYIKSLGISEYIKTMGIRSDEMHRRSIHAKKNNIIYPLMDEIKVNNNFIRKWWDTQPFDLKLKDYQGNCDLCFKKSERKRLTLIKEEPEIATWWLRMELFYKTEKIPRFDLRSNLSIEQLIEKSKKPFKTIHDLHELQQLERTLGFEDASDFETDCFCKAN